MVQMSEEITINHYSCIAVVIKWCNERRVQYALQWAKRSLQLWYMTLLIPLPIACALCKQLCKQRQQATSSDARFEILFLVFCEIILSLSLCCNLFKICFLVETDVQLLNLYDNADSALKRFDQLLPSSSSELLWPHTRPQKEWKITQGPESHKKHLGSTRGGPISSSKD